jgi:hypothetical protein
MRGQLRRARGLLQLGEVRGIAGGICRRAERAGGESPKKSGDPKAAAGTCLEDGD